MKARQGMCVLLLCAMAATAWGQKNAGVAIAGRWEGTIVKLRLVLRIDAADDGSLKGAIDSLDQGNVTIPIETVSVTTGGALRLDIQGIGAVYEGTVTADGAEIDGQWRQGAVNLPLAFRRPGAASKANLKSVTRGRVAFEPCLTADGNTQALCGKHEVYENREKQNGRKIALNIMLLPTRSETPEPDPVFAIAGGPGQSAVETYPYAGFVSDLRRRRDVVLVDQRGTGQSNPLQCAVKNLDDAQDMIGTLFSLDKVRACRIEMEKRADLTQYTTSIAADDMDEVREAMGYRKIDLIGGSYGSRAALVYLRRHGDHVRAIAVREVVPLQHYKLPLPFARTIQASIERLMSDCAADPACHRDYPNLQAEFRAIIRKLEKSPARFELRSSSEAPPQTVTLSREMFLAHLRPVLYVPALASQLPYMLHRASEDDWTPYGNAVWRINRAVEPQIYRGMDFAVICSEDVPFITDAEIRRETGGSYLGGYLARELRKACATWPKGNVPSGFFDPVSSGVPALLISGADDPATPPNLAAEAASGLTNSRLIVVGQGTHGTSSSCIDSLMTQFIERGSATGLDASCVDQIRRPPFLGLNPSAAVRRTVT